MANEHPVIPTTPEQWAAVETNETDAALLNSAELHLAYTPKSEFDKHLALAAASRLLERERCKDEHAHRLAGYLSTLPGNTDKHPMEMLPEARRILEDR